MDTSPVADAGALLLLAAAHETGLISTRESTITPLLPAAPLRLARLRPTTLRAMLLTLLVLIMAGLKRPWDLRGYTGTLIPLLTGRSCAYSYGRMERVVALLAQTTAPAALSTMLAQWATQLWHPTRMGHLVPFPVYIDGHKKPVYSDVLVPRGRIGRTGKILGCRTLTVLNDRAGHPLLVDLTRGDAHLTATLPRLLTTYEDATGSFLRTIIIDREGMRGDFLATLVDHQRIVVTVLRRDQYDGLESFTERGPFEPLPVAADGRVLREVARARVALAVPGRPAQPLLLNVALIRDYRRLPPPTNEADDPDDTVERARWWAEDWTPMPTGRLEAPRLIPIVTTGALGQPRTLVDWYAGRWPAQENQFKLWLLPLGLDVNAGCAKIAVVNSEAAKRQGRCATRAARLEQQAAKAQQALTRRQAQAEPWQQAARSAAETARQVRSADRAQADLHAQAVHTAHVAAEERVEETSMKLQLLRQQQCDVAQAQEDLTQAPPMYELDNRKDQVLTVLKLCAANLGMWTRDQFFPAAYAQAGWERLRPFFALPGQIRVEEGRTVVTFSGFNDRQMNRDLAALCQRVRERAPKLPDGTTLVVQLIPRGCADSDKDWPP